MFEEKEPNKLKVSVLAREAHFSIQGTVMQGIYGELLDFLRDSTPNDIVYLHINTQGGSLDAAVELVHAIQNSPCTVIGCAEGAVVSAGSIIFFACDGFYVGPMSYFMIHDGSQGFIGKINENHKAAEFSAKHLQQLYTTVYSRFFTEEEIQSVLDGRDIYLLAEEVDKRIQDVIEEEQNKEDEVELGAGQITDGAGI